MDLQPTTPTLLSAITHQKHSLPRELAMTTTIESSQEKKIITIFAVLHDDVPESTRKTIYANYFYPFVSELESFTDRKVNVVFWRNSPPYSTYRYKGENVRWISEQWELLAFEFLKEMRAKGFNTDTTTKVILITKEMINDKHAGVATRSPGTAAIASITSYITIGHEVGHLLDARHEDSETQYNGWWCDTYMAPEINTLKSNCYVFSKANRQNINDYLAQKP
jgi:hypothetical protein